MSKNCPLGLRCSRNSLANLQILLTCTSTFVKFFSSKTQKTSRTPVNTRKKKLKKNDIKIFLALSLDLRL